MKDTEADRIVAEMATYIERKSLRPVVAFLLVRGKVSEDTQIDLLRGPEIQGKQPIDIAKMLYAASLADSNVIRAPASYFVVIVRGETSGAAERWGWNIDVPVPERTVSSERDSFLFTAREQNNEQSRIMLEFARGMAQKNEEELQRLTLAAAQADARAADMAAKYFAGVNEYAQALLMHDERASKLAAEKRAAMMFQTVLGIAGDYLPPIIASGLLTKRGLGKDPQSVPAWKWIMTLRSVPPEKFEALSAALGPEVIMALGPIMSGEVVGELVGPLVAKAMVKVPIEKAQAIFQLLGPEAAPGKPNEHQQAFGFLWDLRHHTLAASVDKALGVGPSDAS
jgi:hypothetical protein